MVNPYLRSPTKFAKPDFIVVNIQSMAVPQPIFYLSYRKGISQAPCYLQPSEKQEHMRFFSVLKNYLEINLP